MALTTFTTWTALYNEMLNQLAVFASGKMQTASYSIAGRTLTYRNFDEFKAGLEYVKTMAETESGTAAGRTYAKQGGGGRW